MKNRFFLLILTFWCANGFAQEANQSLPRWSPDGTKYAVVETRKVQGAISSSIKIYRVDADDVFDEPIDLGKMTREMLPDETLPRDPDTALYYFDWAPDSEGYVFSSMGEKNYNLFLSPTLDGEHIYRLTQSDQADITPRWSPDGKSMVFMRGSKLYLIHSNSQFQKKEEERSMTEIPLGDLEKALFPEWDAKGRLIAFSGLRDEDYDIYLYNVQTKHLTRLTQTSNEREYHPVFSPDGKWLAFYSKSKGSGEQFDIAIARADQKALRQCQTGTPPYRVSDGTIRVATAVLQTTLLGPSWMPSSRHLVYVKHDERNGHPLEVVELKFDDPEQQTVRVSSPIPLQTETRYNADVQCTRTGEPRLVFQRFTTVDGLPLKGVKPLDLHSRQTVNPSKKDLLTIKRREGYQIEIVIRSIDSKSPSEIKPLEYPLGSLVKATIEAIVEGERILQEVDVPILEKEPALVFLPKAITLHVHAVVQDQNGISPLANKQIDINGNPFAKTDENGDCQNNIPAFYRPLKEDRGFGRFTVYGEENWYDVMSPDVQKASEDDTFNIKLTLILRQYQVSLIDDEGNALKRAMEVKIREETKPFNTEGIAEIPAKLLKDKEGVTLTYLKADYPGKIVAQEKGYAIKLERPSLALPVRVFNKHGQEIRDFQVTDGGTVEGDGRLRVTGLYHEEQELHFNVNGTPFTEKVTLVPTETGPAYQPANASNPIPATELWRITAPRIDRLVETLVVYPKKPGFEVLLNGRPLGKTKDESGQIKVYPQILEKEALRDIDIKKAEGVMSKPGDYVYFDEENHTAHVSSDRVYPVSFRLQATRLGNRYVMLQEAGKNENAKDKRNQVILVEGFPTQIVKPPLQFSGFNPIALELKLISDDKYDIKKPRIIEIENISPKPFSMAWRSALVPGWGQWHGNRPAEAAGFFLVETAALVGFFLSQDQYHEAKDDYDAAEKAYDQALDVEEIGRLRTEIEGPLKDNRNSKRTLRNVFGAAAVIGWVVNVLDASTNAPLQAVPDGGAPPKEPEKPNTGAKPHWELGASATSDANLISLRVRF